MEEKFIFAMPTCFFFFFGTSRDGITISCSCLALQSKREVKSSSRLEGSDLGGASVECPGLRSPARAEVNSRSPWSGLGGENFLEGLVPGRPQEEATREQATWLCPAEALSFGPGKPRNLQCLGP